MSNADEAENPIMSEEATPAPDVEDQPPTTGRLGARAGVRAGKGGMVGERAPVLFGCQFVVLGEPGAGKTELIGNLVGTPFTMPQFHQSGPTATLNSCNFAMSGFDVRAELIDPPSDTETRSMSARLFGNSATGFILVFDLTKEESFNGLESWIEEFQLLTQDDQFRRPTIVIGTKLDQADADTNAATQAVHILSTTSSATGSVANFPVPLVGVGGGLSTAMGGSAVVDGLVAARNATSTNKGDQGILPKRAINSDDLQVWASDHGAEYFELCSMNGRAVHAAIHSLVKGIIRQLPNGIQTDAKSLIDCRVRPIQDLVGTRRLDYKNRIAAMHRILDTSDSIDWI
ncbi:P-loop containing nucleoside triphosphate hydrolase protein [Blastocladiella britannica]|nr:P-loop containing nucleoside triphosphate hydrolase protein [Blastocladiella britannica]